MRQKVRTYLIANTPKTLTKIKDGKSGELSKISEEYNELLDAYKQNLNMLTFIESLDLIDAVIRFQFRKFNIIAPITYFLIIIRRLYKPIRNKVYTYAGLSKEDFNEGL